MSIALTGNHILDIARGEVAGSTLLHKYGLNPAVTSDAGVAVWSANEAYTYPTEGKVMYASGSSSDDTTTVVVQGLDSDFLEITGYATLNEVNPVALNDSDGGSLSFYRVFRAWNSGSSDLTGAFYVSDSDATLTAGVPGAGEKLAKVDSDHQQTLMAMYTVPAGKSLILYHIGIECTANTAAAVSTTPQAAQVSLRYRENGGVWRTKETFTAITLGSNAVDHFFPARAAIPAETDIELYIYGATTTMGVDGRFWGVLRST